MHQPQQESHISIKQLNLPNGLLARFGLSTRLSATKLLQRKNILSLGHFTAEVNEDNESEVSILKG